MYFEGSGGYAVFSQNHKIVNPLDIDVINYASFANGFAYDAGAGITLFVSPIERVNLLTDGKVGV